MSAMLSCPVSLLFLPKCRYLPSATNLTLGQFSEHPSGRAMAEGLGGGRFYWFGATAERNFNALNFPD